MPDSPTAKPESFACHWSQWINPACAGARFYEHDGKRYCALHYPGKDKSLHFEEALKWKLANKDFNFRGVWFPDEVCFDAWDFSADADFSNATFSRNARFSEARFKAASFNSATFSEKVDFSLATFSGRANFCIAIFGKKASFNHATFSAKADFSDATFNALAIFSYATFAAQMFAGTGRLPAAFRKATFKAAADFHQTTFGAQTDFSIVTFSGLADFRNATFGASADFGSATFSSKADFSFAALNAKLNFREATFADYVRFAGDENERALSATSSLDFQFARIEKPDRVSFHTLTLHPHWFINVDARRLDFTNVQWQNSRKAKLELELLKGKGVSSPNRLLAVACRKLAGNAEENDRYREASHFRRMALDAERLEKWRGFGFLGLSWWYWVASGYGERPFQALLVLISILVVSAAFYMRVGFARWEPKLVTEADAAIAKRDEAGTPLKLSRALTYSAGVMTLQKPEPRPATSAAHTVVLLETILGPVQAALLALAIRRKFMR